MINTSTSFSIIIDHVYSRDTMHIAQYQDTKNNVCANITIPNHLCTRLHYVQKKEKADADGLKRKCEYIGLTRA